MATNYPGALDNTTILKNDATNATLTETTHPTAHNNVSDAILAIETELGVNPSGAGFATVAAAIAALDAGSGAVVVKTPSASQIILPSGDFISLVVQANSSGQTSKVFEVRNNAGTVVAYFDKVGALSAASLAIAGSPLAASHLSNGVQGSGAVVLATSATLATPTLTNPTVTTGTFTSPAMSGTPTAPTAAGGTNNTQIATTAFVQSAVGGGNAIPPGVIMEYSGAAAPTGFLLCDGTAYSRTTYAALFAVCSTNYGAGDGSTTFNVPDFRGRVPVGKGTHADVDTLGDNDGSALADRRPKHKHAGTSSTDGAHTHTGTAASGGAHTHTGSSDTVAAHTHSFSGTTSTGGSHSHSGSTGSVGDHSHNYLQITASAGVQFGGDYTVPTSWSTGTTGGAGSHSHSMSLNSDGSHNHTYSGTSGSSGGHTHTITVNSGGTHSHSVTIDSGGSHSHTVDVGPQTNVPTDGPASLVVNFIIKT